MERAVRAPSCIAAALALFVVASAGCGPPPAVNGVPSDDGAGRVAAFQQLEDDVLLDLAAVDRRLAARGRIAPREEDVRRVNMGAVLAEDATLAVIDGAIDPFSFEARGRGLAAAKTKLGTAPRDLPAAAQGMLPAPALEKELLSRMVEEEIVRLEEERALPRSASALVRAVVDTWSVPASPQQAAERDRWLTRRLAEIRVEVARAEAALDVVRARELDDALDALEHAVEAAGLVHATSELVKLREALEAQATHPAAGAASEWNVVARGVRAHLGFALAPEALDARLASLETTLRAAAEQAIARGGLGSDALAAHAAPLLFAAGACGIAVPGSRLRSMASPPERAAACRLRQAVAGAEEESARTFALVAMHDHVVVAQWALDVARGSLTIAQSTAKHRPLSRPGPDVAARWERVALARPTAAIGGGLGAGVLYGTGDTEARARVWSALGDVPLDVAEREMAVSSATKEPRP